ncbi:MAG: hypothetical protein F7C32_01495 [Desulfurococcales archaeon]|nr:hypothetical protein [Desulfurococcales archaeon]
MGIFGKGIPRWVRGFVSELKTGFYKYDLQEYDLVIADMYHRFFKYTRFKNVEDLREKWKLVYNHVRDNLGFITTVDTMSTLIDRLIEHVMYTDPDSEKVVKSVLAVLSIVSQDREIAFQNIPRNIAEFIKGRVSVATTGYDSLLEEVLGSLTEKIVTVNALRGEPLNGGIKLSDRLSIKVPSANVLVYPDQAALEAVRSSDLVIISLMGATADNELVAEMTSNMIVEAAAEAGVPVYATLRSQNVAWNTKLEDIESKVILVRMPGVREELAIPVFEMVSDHANIELFTEYGNISGENVGYLRDKYWEDLLKRVKSLIP